MWIYTPVEQNHSSPTNIQQKMFSPVPAITPSTKVHQKNLPLLINLWSSSDPPMFLHINLKPASRWRDTACWPSQGPAHSKAPSPRLKRRPEPWCALNTYLWKWCPVLRNVKLLKQHSKTQQWNWSIKVRGRTKHWYKHNCVDSAAPYIEIVMKMVRNYGCMTFSGATTLIIWCFCSNF